MDHVLCAVDGWHRSVLRFQSPEVLRVVAAPLDGGLLAPPPGSTPSPPPLSSEVATAVASVPGGGDGANRVAASGRLPPLRPGGC
jgi:hypothetical protein